MKYRKKPVVIDAMQYDGSNADAVIEWVNQWHQEDDGPGIWLEDAELRILTLEGEMGAFEGWWVIRGVEGEFYSCKPSVFEATYDAPCGVMVGRDKSDGPICCDLPNGHDGSHKATL